MKVRNPRFRQDLRELLLVYSLLIIVWVVLGIVVNSQAGFFVFLAGALAYGMRMLVVGEHRRRKP